MNSLSQGNLLFYFLGAGSLIFPSTLGGKALLRGVLTENNNYILSLGCQARAVEQGGLRGQKEPDARTLCRKAKENDAQTPPATFTNQNRFPSKFFSF